MMKYKDTLFRSTFKEPREAIKLYNVISGSNYDINTPIEVNVLDEMMFSDKENDVSFVLENRLVIFIEHQSTINRNMPLRFIEYLSANYRCIRGRKKYAGGLIRLPKPEFYVLYNGTDTWDREYLKLSDSFADCDTKDTFVELVAKVINIKPENAGIDIKANNELYVYSVFVSQVQRNVSNGDAINVALRKAREYCFNLGLSSSLLDRWREVSKMYLEEFSYFDGERDMIFEKGMEKGMEMRNIEIILNLSKHGMNAVAIAKTLNLTPEYVEQILSMQRS